MATVFVREAAYDPATLKPLVFELLAALDRQLIRKDRRDLPTFGA